MERAVVSLSLVVPTYKRSRVVKRCLDSVQHQTLADFELLLVDNSPDTELRALVDDFNQTARRKARYVAEPRLGLHNAGTLARGPRPAMCWYSPTMMPVSTRTGWRPTRAVSEHIRRWPRPADRSARPGSRPRPIG